MRPSITLVNRGVPTPESNPQCTWLLQRIEELDAELALESEPARAHHWRAQLRVVVERAHCLGCFGCPAARGSPIP